MNQSCVHRVKLKVGVFRDKKRGWWIYMYSEAGENEHLTSVFDKTQQFLFACFVFGHATWHMGSKLPDQGWNPKPCSGSIES